jgi:hypothetical protein
LPAPWPARASPLRSIPRSRTPAVGHHGKTFDTASNDLERGWNKARGTSRLAWHDAKDAVKDGWNRVENNVNDPSYPSQLP